MEEDTRPAKAEDEANAPEAVEDETETDAAVEEEADTEPEAAVLETDCVPTAVDDCCGGAELSTTMVTVGSKLLGCDVTRCICTHLHDSEL